MKRIFLLSLFICAAASAQEANTTVHITNSYKTGVGEVTRAGLPVRIPDSLSHFDYKFEYSVFDTPYQSAYEFRPFAVTVTPEADDIEDRSFWMKLGAGYPVKPELKFVWMPVRKEKVRMVIRQNLYGFWGKYRTVRKNIASSPLMTTAGVRHSGYDFAENLGADLSWKVKRSTMNFGADYDGFFNQDEFARSYYNAGRFNLGFETPSDAGFGFKMKIDGSIASDNLPDLKVLDNKAFRENVFGLEGYLAPKLSKEWRLRIGYKARYVDYSQNGSSYPNTYFGAEVKPVFEFAQGVFDFKAGANLGFAGSGLKVSPILDLSLLLFKRTLTLYADCRSGYKYNSLSTLKSANHWFTISYSPTMKPSYEFLNARVGLRGSIAGRLQYDLNAGYSITQDEALYKFRLLSDNTLVPALGFAEYKDFYATARIAWHSERIDADGKITWQKTNLGGLSQFIDAPMLKGNGRIMYNYKRRLYAAVLLDASASRNLVISGTSMKIPFWFDLGLYAEYKVTKKFSVWAKGSNLLNQPIQRLPMHVEQGIGGTVGICLDLK